jgi:hypothetical protein
VPSQLVEEVACEFQLDEAGRIPGSGSSNGSERDPYALLEDLDELLERLRRSNFLTSASRERKHEPHS